MTTRTKSLLAFASLTALTFSAVNAETLLVDLDHAGSTTQSGWESWDLNQNFTGVLNQSTTFSFADATDGNVDISLSTSTTAGTRNYGTDGATPGTLSNPNVYTDLWFFNNNTSGTLTVTLDDLSAGSYEFTSYHFANDLSTGNSGIADISLNGVDTGLNATLEVANPPGLTIPAADVEAGNRTISFTVANDNDTVTILYDNLDGNGGGNSFGLNGFELAVAPEPSTFPLTITPNASNPGNYDFSWDSQAGKTYDLVSETGLSTSIATWPVWMGNADIPSSGTGMNTLTDVAGGGDTKRFFAVIEKDP